MDRHFMDESSGGQQAGRDITVYRPSDKLDDCTYYHHKIDGRLSEIERDYHLLRLLVLTAALIMVALNAVTIHQLSRVDDRLSSLADQLKDRSVQTREIMAETRESETSHRNRILVALADLDNHVHQTLKAEIDKAIAADQGLSPEELLAVERINRQLLDNLEQLLKRYLSESK